MLNSFHFSASVTTITQHTSTSNCLMHLTSDGVAFECLLSHLVAGTYCVYEGKKRLVLEGRGSADKTLKTGASRGFKALQPWSGGGSGPLIPPAFHPKDGRRKKKLCRGLLQYYK